MYSRTGLAKTTGTSGTGSGTIYNSTAVYY